MSLYVFMYFLHSPPKFEVMNLFAIEIFGAIQSTIEVRREIVKLSSDNSLSQIIEKEIEKKGNKIKATHKCV